jgi:hypothetical protein
VWGGLGITGPSEVHDEVAVVERWGDEMGSRLGHHLVGSAQHSPTVQNANQSSRRGHRLWIQRVFLPRANDVNCALGCRHSKVESAVAAIRSGPGREAIGVATDMGDKMEVVATSQVVSANGVVLTQVRGGAGIPTNEQVASERSVDRG